jgi:hypothetical protein
LGVQPVPTPWKVLPAAHACGGFAGPALVLLGVLALGRGPETLLPLLVALPVLGTGARFLSATHGARADPSRVVATAIAYLVAFVPGTSLWAFWLAADPAGRTPAVVPIVYLVGAFLSGVAWVAAVATLHDPCGPDVRHDLGKLLFGLAALWSYLVWALVLPTWYGNEPAEAAYLLARFSGAYRPATVALLLAVSVGPLLLLLPERAKRRRASLAAAAFSILLGSWLAPHLMALPPLRVPGEPWGLLAGAAVGVGMAGVFLLSVGALIGESTPPPASGRISARARTT